MNQIYEFFVNHGFILEMLLASFFFVHTLKRRKFFWISLILFTAAYFGCSLLWDIIFPESPVSQISKYTFLFFIATFGVMLCFKTNFWTAFYCEIGAYATQHCAFKIGSAVRLIAENKVDVISQSVIYVLTFIIVCCIFYFVFARLIKKNQTKNFENKQVILLSIALILFTTTFQFIYDFFARTLERDILLPLFLIIAAYDVMCCIFTLCIQYGMFRSGKLEEENKLMEHVLHLQKEQLETSKDNIDMINIKCHDLKHHISQLGDRISRQELDELKKIISIYDLTLKTGSEALDVILAEKSLYCGRNNIKLDCIAHGEKLVFMSAPDIYSLFGNAIDNAIEAVQQIENIDKRIISISVKENIGMLSVHIENYFKGELKFIDELPQTTKGDNKYHGFGMKSIKMIVEKYKGDLTIKTENDVFNLNILLPAPQ